MRKKCFLIPGQEHGSGPDARAGNAVFGASYSGAGAWLGNVLAVEDSALARARMPGRAMPCSVLPNLGTGAWLGVVFAVVLIRKIRDIVALVLGDEVIVTNLWEGKFYFTGCRMNAYACFVR